GVTGDGGEIGEKRGAPPPEPPAAPLQRDLEVKQHRLNMPATPEIKLYDLDLRNVKNRFDRDRSQLLHQLRLLGIEWGQPQRGQRTAQGEFHEYWQVKWEPEFAVKLIEANVYGNTLEAASNA